MEKFMAKLLEYSNFKITVTAVLWRAHLLWKMFIELNNCSESTLYL